MRRQKGLFELIRERDVAHIGEQLDSSPAMINVKDPLGLEPLHHCIMTGRNEIAELLLSKGARCDIFSASGLGMLDQVQTMLREKPSLHAGRDSLGLTPLHWAALGGKVDVGEVLIAHGAKIDAGDSSGVTPLHCAAVNGHKAIAELLVAHGADLAARDKTGAWPALRAVKEGHKDLAASLKCNLDDATSTRFLLGASIVFCAAEAAVCFYLVWRASPVTPPIGSPYSLLAALGLFSIAWIAIAACLYVQIGKDTHGTGAASSRIVCTLAGLVTLVTMVAGIVLVIVGIRALLT